MCCSPITKEVKHIRVGVQRFVAPPFNAIPSMDSWCPPRYYIPNSQALR